MTGLVLYGINNIYTVLSCGQRIECRIKGKVLKTAEKEYNPIACGDWVEFEQDSSGKGLIASRAERRNALVRCNQKEMRPQTLAANIDRIFCVCSPQSPPFRSAFIDRVLVACQHQNIECSIILNKKDQGIEPSVAECLDYYQKQEVQVFFVSALYNDGLTDLRSSLEGKIQGFVGQSGVGKSKLLNALYPHLALRTGDVSKKFNRGSHTTNYPQMVFWDGTTGIIDTPGIREFAFYELPSRNLCYYFPEFKKYLGKCSYASCTHTIEPDCSVRQAAETSGIADFRYANYLKIFEAVAQQEKEVYG